MVKCPECNYEDKDPITFREHVEQKHLTAYWQYHAWATRNKIFEAFYKEQYE